ncbi:MAG: AAA family ATPase [Bacillota bacterium]
MELYLDNIGIIKDSTIKLDGLTVITGENNSGKSTVGKALFGAVNATRDFDFLYEKDLKQAKNNLFEKIAEIYEFNKIDKYIDKNLLDHLEEICIEVLSSLSKFDFFMSDKYSVNNIDFSVLSEFIQTFTKDRLQTVVIDDLLTTRARSYINSFQKRYDTSCKEYRAYVDFKDENRTIDAFTRNLFTDSIGGEFNHQIKPVNSDDDSMISLIEMSSENISYLQLKFKNEKIFGETYKKWNRVYDNILFIDNPFVVDNIDGAYRDYVRNTMGNVSIENRGFYNIRYRSRITFSKNELLLRSLVVNNDDKSRIEQEIEYDKNSDVIKKIENALPGAIKFEDGKMVYAEESKKSLSVKNLATGSKMFAIIKQLVMNNQLKHDTMLILDEPESHLHPEWQNIFAEVVVLLIKELSVNILLTTHSINFMLAIETFMREYEINDKTNFYMTDKQDGGMVCYKCVNDSLNEIYAQFNRSYVEMYDRLNDMAVEDMVE